MGEGEIRFPLLIEKIEKKDFKEITEMDGIGYRRDGAIQINLLQNFIQGLDSLPHPARRYLDLDRYRVRKKRSTMIITSRGCPHGCAYCSAHLVMGNSFRVRTPEAILTEMVECQKKYGIQIFDIEDDNFTFDQARAKRLMSLIIKHFGDGEIELSAMNGVSFASLDEELLKLMEKAVAEQVGLNIIAYAILGMPGQTIEEMVNTLIYLMGRKVLIGPSIYYPSPGTPLFERCKRDGILPPHLSQWRSSAFPIETKEFNRLDLLTLFRLARIINFIKGKMDEKVLEEGMTWKELHRILEEKVKAYFY